MEILNEDCLFAMSFYIEDNSVDSIVTDPPYGLSFMGKKWDYDVPSKEIWTEALRVLKPGGHLLSFAGTRTYHRMAVNIEDAGFEIRDQVMWLYGSGFPKSLDVSKAIDKSVGAEREVIGVKKSPDGRDYSIENAVHTGEFGGENAFKQSGMNMKKLELTVPATEAAKQWQGWGTALKPANEPIVVARKPLEKGLTVAQNVLKYGTGALNIDGSRIGYAPKGLEVVKAVIERFKKSNNQNGIDKGAFQASKELIPNDPSKGRWPANVILDEEAAQMLDSQVGDNVSRFFYVAKASKRERNAGLEGPEAKQVSHMITGSGKPSESVKERCADGEPNRFTATHQNHHPTVKPIKLMEYLIKLVTPHNGTVLDPFMGSGSTGVAARNLGFGFIGIEREQEYFEIAKKRIGK